MSDWLFRNVGAPGTSFNAACTPGQPASIVINDWMFIVATELIGSDARPAAPTGWTDVTLAVNWTTGSVVYAKQATSTNEAMPAIASFGNQQQVAVCLVYSGGWVGLPSGLVDTAHSSDRSYNSTGTLVYNATGVPAKNRSMILAISFKNTLGNATPVLTETGGLVGATRRVTRWPNGVLPTIVVDEIIQTTAAAIATPGMNMNFTEASTQAGHSIILIFNPAPDLAGTPVSASTGTGNLSTGILLAGTPVSAATVTGDLNRLIAAATIASTGVGSLNTAIQLAVAAAISSVATGSLATAVPLAAAASSLTSAAASLTNWSTVTLTNPLFTGVGSVVDQHAWPGTPPGAGNTVYYDGTYITIAVNGEISSTNNNCRVVVQYFDGAVWQKGLVVLTSGMVGYADIGSVAAGALVTAIRLLGSANALSVATAGLNTQIMMSAAGVSLTTAIGALASAIQLASDLVVITAATGTLTGTSNALRGDAVSDSTGAAFLNAQIRLVGAAASVVAAAGVLSAQIRLNANALSVSGGQGSLNTQTMMAAVAAATSVATGALFTQIKIAGAAIELATASGTLLTQIKLIANAVALSSATASLQTFNGLAGAAAAVSNAQGAITTLISMRSTGFSLTAAQAALLTAIPLSGGAFSTDIVKGALTATGSQVGLYPEDPFFVIGIRRQYFTQRFPVIGPGEVHVLSFNFADELAAGESLNGNIVVNVVASAGVDGTLPGSLLNGVASYDTTLTKVAQPIHGAIQDNDYYFTVIAPTSNPYKTLTRYGLLSVRG